MKRAMTRMTGGRSMAGCGIARATAAAAVMIGATGCVQVKAPDKPIEIVLTINIRQEIVYRLDRDAKELIEQNAEIF